MVPFNVMLKREMELNVMKTKPQAGFSLIELLLVCVIIGIVAAIAIPNFQRATHAAENGSAYSLMRTIASTEATYYSVRNRYARLDELASTGTNLGATLIGPRLQKGKFFYETMPLTPTDDELKTDFKVAGVRTIGMNLRYEVTQTGVIVDVPVP